jgi:AcrR family transcriptional regulator
MVVRARKAKAAPQRAVRDYAKTAYTEAILDAAERLFLRVGYHDAKMADVAAEAGVAVGTLYKYFDSKEEVFASLSARVRNDLMGLLEGAVSSDDPLERLRDLVRRSFVYAEDHGAMLAIYTQLGVVSELQIRSAGGEAAEQIFDKFLERIEAILVDGVSRGLIRDDLPAAVLATVFAGVMNATLYHWVRSERKASLADRAEAMLNLFLEGARAP